MSTSRFARLLKAESLSDKCGTEKRILSRDELYFSCTTSSCSVGTIFLERALTRKAEKTKLDTTGDVASMNRKQDNGNLICPDMEKWSL